MVSAAVSRCQPEVVVRMVWRLLHRREWRWPNEPVEMDVLAAAGDFLGRAHMSGSVLHFDPGIIPAKRLRRFENADGRRHSPESVFRFSGNAIADYLSPR